MICSHCSIDEVVDDSAFKNKYILLSLSLIFGNNLSLKMRFFCLQFFVDFFMLIKIMTTFLK